jgi:tetratricopeptide (TPR) repeat protein
VELLRFIPKEKFAEVLFMSVDDRAELPFEDVLQAALTFKREGNTKYHDGDYRGALKLYSRGIDLLENYPTATEADNTKRDDALPELCCNKAQCLLKLESPARACVACKLGLRTTDENTRPKLLIRFAEAKYLLNAYQEARDVCLQAIKMFRAQKILQDKHTDLLKKIDAALAEEKKKEAFLCRSMLKMNTDAGPSSKK